MSTPWRPMVRLRRGDGERWLLGALVVFAVLAAFSPALDNDFVAWDDGIYIRDNPLIRCLGLANLRGMLTAATGALWQPLTLLSFALDYRLWNLDPWGFHLTNILLHAAAAVLFYLICLRLFELAGVRRSKDGVEGAALAALFFAVHPLRAESVAWATERKDVLSGALFLAALLLRLRGRPKMALATFALALSSKISVVTLPAVFVILEIYPLRRLPLDCRRWLERPFRPFWLSLVPYAGLAAAAATFTVAAARADGALRGLGAQGVSWRLGQAFYGTLFYPTKTLWPAALAAYYPPRPWFGQWGAPLLGCAAAVLAAGAAVAWSSRRRPWLGAALACYAVMLLPMSGLLKHGVVPFSVCDRFSYLPCLSLAVLFGAAFAGARPAVRAMAAVWLIALGAASWRQCGVWRDTVALWSASCARAPSELALTNLGNALFEAGLQREGLARLEQAVADYPEQWLGFDNLGVALHRLKQERRAREVWRRGLEREETCQLHAHLGAALFVEDGAYAREGLAHLRAAVAMCPQSALLRVDLADALARSGRPREAGPEYVAALALDPQAALAHGNFGLLLAGQGRFDEAASHYRRALYGRQGRAEALHNWGNLLLESGKLAEAERRYREALRLDPGLARAHVNLGNILARRGRLAEAADRYVRALKEDPGLVEARANLSAVRRALGRY